MKKLVFVGLFLMTILASAQTIITKTLDDFSELKVYNGIDLELIKSNEQKIIISGEKAEKVIVKNKGNKLKIYLKLPETLAKGKVRVQLFFNKDIDVVDANEGATVTGKGIQQSSLEAKVQEGAFMNLVVDVKHLKVKASSGGIVKLSGSVKNQEVDVDLGGVYHGYKVKVENMCIVRSGSGGKAEVNAGETLNAKVSFGGSIYYKGTPEVLKDRKVIGGVIEKRG